jgi:hypothetical protein
MVGDTGDLVVGGLHRFGDQPADVAVTGGVVDLAAGPVGGDQPGEP